MFILAVDPGRDKCGVAVLAGDKTVAYQRVIETARLEQVIAELVAKYNAIELVIGNGTTSTAAQARIAAACPAVHLHVVDEYRTTDMARVAYWAANPPRGLRRLLPTTMQVPPVPVDDYVAVILATRFIEAQETAAAETNPRKNQESGGEQNV